MKIRNSILRGWVLSIAAGGAVALGLLAARPSLADDPAPLSEAEQARVKTLVENLGSDDFRMREAATKELIEFGARARGALEKARGSEVPEVRFRADQILRRLEGNDKERPFSGGRAPDAGGPQPEPDLFRGWTGIPQADREEVERWVREFQKQTEEFRGRFGQGGGGMPWPWPGAGGLFARPTRRHFTADGVDLRVQEGGARLSVTEKIGTEVVVTHVYEGKSLDAILAARPELKDHAGVASVVEQRKKAEEEAAAQRTQPQRPSHPFTFRSTAQGVQIESTPGHVKVTITEDGPDGKPTTKTYEGTDLETLKREHPELADKLGGMTFRFQVDGFGPGKPEAGPGGERPFRFGPSEPPVLPEPTTGPFGLGLRAGEDGKSVTVVAVRPGSDAAKLGLETGDVLVSINGTSVTLDGATSARDLIRAAKDGAMTVEILRDGKPLTLKR